MYKIGCVRYLKKMGAEITRDNSITASVDTCHWDVGTKLAAIEIIHIQEVYGSNLGRVIGNSEMLVVLLSSSRQIPE
jgi:hypothetical protein